uniref:RING-type domain-containing protein n=1 Tax=Parastrongyloides trichosuri TaxID=131310 RepID=A0A0N4ZCF4_PARTI
MSNRNAWVFHPDSLDQKEKEELLAHARKMEEDDRRAREDREREEKENAAREERDREERKQEERARESYFHHSNICQKCLKPLTSAGTPHEEITLPCGETFGRSCIPKLETSIGPVVECPFCNRLFPDTSQDDLNGNFDPFNDQLNGVINNFVSECWFNSCEFDVKKKMPENK